MSTRPKVTRQEVAEAILRIARRRLEIDDRDRDLLPDSPESDPREVLDYLIRHSGSSIPIRVRHQDAKDALLLNNWLWWEDRKRELFFLDAGVQSGVFLRELGSMLGIGKQGVRDRIDRLTALLRTDEHRPDEKVIRRRRRKESDRESAEVRATPESIWLTANRPELQALINGLNNEAERHGLSDRDREWLDELMIDVKEDHLTPRTMVMLGLAIADIRVSDAVVELPTLRPHKVHLLLRRADDLRSAYAAAGLAHG